MVKSLSFVASQKLSHLVILQQQVAILALYIQIVLVLSYLTSLTLLKLFHQEYVELNPHSVY